MTLKQEEFLQELEHKSCILGEITKQIQTAEDEEMIEHLRRLGDRLSSEIKIMLLVYDVMFSKIYLN